MRQRVKKITALLLVFCMFASMMPTAMAESTPAPLEFTGQTVSSGSAAGTKSDPYLLTFTIAIPEESQTQYSSIDGAVYVLSCKTEDVDNVNILTGNNEVVVTPENAANQNITTSTQPTGTYMFAAGKKGASSITVTFPVWLINRQLTEDVVLTVRPVTSTDGLPANRSGYVLSGNAGQLSGEATTAQAVELRISAGRHVAYDANGGTGATLPEDTLYTDAQCAAGISLTAAGTLAKAGYAFAGWLPATEAPADVAADGTLPEGLLAAGATVNPLVDTTYYAVWGADENGNGKPDCDETRYSIYFDGNGGTSPKPKVIAEKLEDNEIALSGADSAVTTLPTKTGNVLVGWSTEMLSVLTKNDTLPDSVIQVAALDEGSTAKYVVAPADADGTDITLYAVWGTDDNTDGKPDVLDDHYTVAFDANGGTEDPASVTGQTAGEAVTLPTATHSDVDGTAYVLYGWSKTASAEVVEKDTAEEDIPEVVTDPYTVVVDDATEKVITLHAVWAVDGNGDGEPDVKQTFVTLSYDNETTEGTTGDLPADEDYVAGDTVTLAGAVLTNDKLTLAGWSTDADHPVVPKDALELPVDVYALGADNYEMPDTATTLHAVWAVDDNGNGEPDYKETKYAVNFNANGGVDTTLVSGRVNGEELPLEGADAVLTAPTRTGYVLLGWNATKVTDIAADGTMPADLTAAYTDADDTYTVDGTKAASGIITLYAVWAVDGNGNGKPDCTDTKYTVAFDANGGTEDPASVEDQLETAEVTLPTAAHAQEDGVDVVLYGWSKTASEGILTTADKDSLPEIIDGTAYTVAADDAAAETTTITLHAVWSMDTNGNGEPDVNEDLKALTYADENTDALIEDTTLPAAENHIAAEKVTLPAADAMKKDKLVLVGWSETADPAVLDASALALPVNVYEAGYTEYAMPDAATTLHAVWAADENGNGTPDYKDTKYTVNFNANGGADDASVANKVAGSTVDVDADITAPTREEYTLVGWNDTALEDVAADATELPTMTVDCKAEGAHAYTVTAPAEGSTVTLYAVWAVDLDGDGTPDCQETRYTINFEANGGEGEATYTDRVADSVIVLYDEDFTFSEFTREGYALVGWNDTALEDVASNGTIPAMTVDCTTDGTHAYTVVAPTEGTTVTLYAIWAVDQNGNGKPDCEETRYSVSKYDWSTDETVADQPEGSKVALSVAQETVEEDDVQYLFYGWTIAAEKPAVLTKDTGGADVPALLADNTTYTVNSADAAGGAITLYSVWAEDRNGDGEADVDQAFFTLTYADENTAEYIESTSLAEAKSCAVGETVTVPAAATMQKAKLTLAGWVTTENPTTIAKAGFAPNGMIAAGGSYTMPEMNATLHAVWAVDDNGDGTPDYQQAKYAVNFDANGGANSVTLINKVAGESISVDSDITPPTRNGYVLLGWNVGSKLNDVAADQEIPAMTLACTDDDDVYSVTEDDATESMITLYAVWAVDGNGNGEPDTSETRYTVTFNANGGTVEQEDITGQLVGDSITLSNATRPDETNMAYIFQGWTTEKFPEAQKEGDTKIVAVANPYTVVEEDADQETATITLYAVWSEDADGDGVGDVDETFALLTYEDGNTAALTKGAELLHEAVNHSIGMPLTLISATELTKDKLVLVGWVTTENPATITKTGSAPSGMAAAGGKYTMPEMSTTLYAVWAIDDNGDGIPDYQQTKYTVIFDANGGAAQGVASNKVDKENLNVDSDITPPTREGYILLGWSYETAAALEGTDTADAIPALAVDCQAEGTHTYQVNADHATDAVITLHAVWAADVNGNGQPDYEETKYTVSFICTTCVGAGTEDLTNKVEGEEIALLQKEHATEEGVAYLLKGWTLTEDPDVLTATTPDSDIPTLVADPYAVNVDDANADKQINLFPVWAEDRNGNGKADMDEDVFTLTYDGNSSTSGTAPADGNVYLTSSTAVVAGAGDLAKTGKTFLGWSKTTVSDVTIDKTQAYVDGLNLLKESDSLPMNANTTLYAVWADDSDGDGQPDYAADKYTVNFVMGTGLESVIVVNQLAGTVLSVGSAETDPTITVPARQGYALIGWTTVAAAAGDVSLNGPVPSNLMLRDDAEEGEKDPYQREAYTVNADDAKGNTITLYMVWGQDIDTNGTADILEKDSVTIVRVGEQRQIIGGPANDEVEKTFSWNIRVNDAVPTEEETLAKFFVAITPYAGFSDLLSTNYVITENLVSTMDSDYMSIIKVEADKTTTDDDSTEWRVVTITVSGDKSSVANVTPWWGRSGDQPIVPENASEDSENPSFHLVVPGDVNLTGEIDSADLTTIVQYFNGSIDMPTAGADDFLFELADNRPTQDIGAEDIVHMVQMFNGSLASN